MNAAASRTWSDTFNPNPSVKNLWEVAWSMEPITT